MQWWGGFPSSGVLLCFRGCWRVAANNRTAHSILHSETRPRAGAGGKHAERLLPAQKVPQSTAKVSHEANIVLYFFFSSRAPLSPRETKIKIKRSSA